MKLTGGVLVLEEQDLRRLFAGESLHLFGKVDQIMLRQCVVDDFELALKEPKE